MTVEQRRVTASRYVKKHRWWYVLTGREESVTAIRFLARVPWSRQLEIEVVAEKVVWTGSVIVEVVGTVICQVSTIV